MDCGLSSFRCIGNTEPIIQCPSGKDITEKILPEPRGKINYRRKRRNSRGYTHVYHHQRFRAVRDIFCQTRYGPIRKISPMSNIPEAGQICNMRHSNINIGPCPRYPKALLKCSFGIVQVLDAMVKVYRIDRTLLKGVRCGVKIMHHIRSAVRTEIDTDASGHFLRTAAEIQDLFIQPMIVTIPSW